MPNKLKPGNEIVPGYVLVRRLGAGGSGEVWVARAAGGVQVAIKILSDLALIASDRELEALRVVREAKHPNLCPLFGVWFFDSDNNLLSSQESESILGSETDMTETVALGAGEARDTSAEFDSTDGGTLAIPSSTTKPAQMIVAMGLGEQTLMDRLVQVQAEKELAAESDSDDGVPDDDQVGIDADELMRYMASAASAIDELNGRHNIYHCDIKPQNILLVGGQAQVCDFGLARKVEDSRKTTIAFGTPAYGAPEMLFERTYSKTIDQYSLAVTYYELRTGKLPYSSVTQSALLRAKATGEVDLSRVPTAEAEVLARATDLDPEKRYKNCQTMVAALGEAVKNPNAVTASPPKMKTRIAMPIAAASVAALLAAAGFLVPWGSLLGEASTSGSSAQNRVDPVAIDAGSVLTDSGTETNVTVEPTGPEPVEPEPIEPVLEPQPDVDAQILAVLKADAPNSKRLSDVLEIVRSRDADLDVLAPPTMELLIEGIETETPASVTGKDSSTAHMIVQLCSALIPIADRQSGKDSPTVARLVLSRLSSATTVAQNAGDDVADQHIDSVRKLFNDRNQFSHPPESYQAAITVANSWIPKFLLPNWDHQLAERDILRAQQLGRDREPNLPALRELNSSYLLGLLNARRTSDQPELFDAATVRVAKELEDDEASGTLARSSISLVDPNAIIYKAKSIGDDASVLESLPKELHATYLLGAGWNHWTHSKNKDAVSHWEQATKLPSLSSDAVESDRHTAAEHLLDWLLGRSPVPETNTARLRYADMAGRIDPIMSIAAQLAEGNADLVSRIDREKFICSVAAGDFEEAITRWRKVETQANGNSSLSQQQSLALFDLAMHQIESSDGKPDTQWVNQLLRACNAQADADLFGPMDGRPAGALLVRNDLYRRCFKPTIEQIRDQIATPEQIDASEIDELYLALFCERMVSLMTESDCRSYYGAVVPYLRDIELAASIAGRSSARRDQRSKLFFHATHAFARSIHEEQDDRRYSDWIKTFVEYRDQSKKFGTNAYTDCLEGLVSREQALRETDPQRAYRLHAAAIEKFTSAIKSNKKMLNSVASLSLASMSLAGRARAQQLAAIMETGERQEKLLQATLKDAREAVEKSKDVPANLEYALEDLARLRCAVSQIPETRKAEEKLELILDAKHTINEAIAIRRNQSLDDSQLAIAKLFVHWIATMVITERPQSFAVIQSAKDWVTRTEDIRNGATSSRLMCNWFFYSAMILESAGEWELGLNHLVTARQIVSRDLQDDELITHLVALGYVSLKSNQLESGNRSQRLQLIDELTKELNNISNPTPPVASKRDAYLDLLNKQKSLR